VQWDNANTTLKLIIYIDTHQSETIMNHQLYMPCMSDEYDNQTHIYIYGYIARLRV